LKLTDPHRVAQRGRVCSQDEFDRVPQSEQRRSRDYQSPQTHPMMQADSRSDEDSKILRPMPVVSLPKPQFNELKALQTTQGNWKPDSRELLQRFFAKPLPQGMPDTVLCTLAALCVLEIVFKDERIE